MGTERQLFRAYNTLINPDYLEEDVYPEGYPVLVIIHTSNSEVAHAHWHHGMEIVHVIHGGGLFTVDGHHHLLLDGDSLLVSPYQLHQATTLDSGHGPVRIVSVTFNNEMVSKIYPFADRALFP